MPPLTTETLFWAIATSCLVMAVGYALISTYPPSTTMVCTAPIASALGVFLHRKWAEQRGAGEALPALLFAENHAEAKHGLAELADAPGIQVKAVILPASERRHAFLAGVPIDSAGQILRWVRERQVRLLILASPDAGSLRPALAPCVGAGCRIERIRDLTAKVHGRVDLLGSDEIDLLGRLTSGAHRFPLQRLVDLVLAMIVLVPALAIGGLVALGIKLTSKGPVFFRQTRMGRWGRRFGILKFRTMRRDAERESGPVFAQPDDPRITPFGRFLRKTRLDEIPQIVNVILGDMSLVGPRPERPHFVRTLRQGIPLYDARHSVRPGLTGWAQIRYRYGASDEDARNKLAYELFYILNRSLVFYLAVLLETVKVVLFRRGGQ